MLLGHFVIKLCAFMLLQQVLSILNNNIYFCEYFYILDSVYHKAQDLILFKSF